ncbi:MAG TPA: hypothetical protein VIF43_02870 [Patescibacteria group bacterium]|jgi:hypothetical protein
MIEQAERVPFTELPAERALELVREWRIAAENNNPADSLQSTDRLAGFVKLTSGEVTGRKGRPGPDSPGSHDPRVIDEVLAGVKFVMRDGDTFDLECSRSFQGSLQRVADVCVVGAIRNIIETGKDQGREEEIAVMLAELASSESEFGRRERAQQEVVWLLDKNLTQGRYQDTSVDGLAAIAKRARSSQSDALLALAEAEQSPDTPWGAKAAQVLDEGAETPFAKHLVQSAREHVRNRAAAA